MPHKGEAGELLKPGMTGLYVVLTGLLMNGLCRAGLQAGVAGAAILFQRCVGGQLKRG